jgi:MerR family transcriptional regulator, copper efflux regulator
VTTYLIAEVAERSGFSPPTLRYYETIGLLPPAERGGNGYRLYGEATLERLGFIVRAKQLGCSLEEIAELTQAWEDGHCPPVKQRLQAVIAAKVTEAQARIAELTVLTADLQRAAAGLSAHTPDGPCDDSCGCVSTPETGTGSAPVALTTKPASTGSGDGCGDEDVPIACTLGAGEMPGRLDEWNALLDGSGDLLDGVIARVTLDGGIRLEFGPNSDVTEIARLAAAEQVCCRFFSFALVIDQRGTALEVHAPAEGQTVLTELFGAASRSRSSPLMTS